MSALDAAVPLGPHPIRGCLPTMMVELVNREPKAMYSSTRVQKARGCVPLGEDPRGAALPRVNVGSLWELLV